MAEVGREAPGVSAVSAGGREVSAFEAIYSDHRNAVLGLAYVMSGRWGLAEEVTQDAFIKLMDGMAAGTVDNPAGWVRTVAMNLARSRVRRIKAEIRALMRLGGRRHEHAELDTRRVESEAFWAVVRLLPSRQAEALALHYQDDRPVREVAELMGIAEGTAKALLHQGRHRLAERLGPSDPEDV